MRGWRAFWYGIDVYVCFSAAADIKQENYGRAKETHAHTQALWEKEIRRARKENFKSQSVVVKLQEELKTARTAVKSADSDLKQEKARSAKREQEAFAARYQLVGVQEELANLQEKIKLVEQERDALRTIAKNEEIARIAAEGRIPLPTLAEDDEFASPKKSPRALQRVTITSSAASEEELEDMKMRLTWEARRADRAQDRIDFLELECRSNCCLSSRESRESPVVERQQQQQQDEEEQEEQQQQEANISAIHAPQNTIYVPSEGVFRTVSPAPESPRAPSAQQMPPPQSIPTARSPSHYARTPSCEPPSHAVALDMNTSLLSLLDPRSRGSTPLDAAFPSTFSVPTITIPPHPSPSVAARHAPSPSQPQPPSTSDEDESSYRTISHTTTIPLSTSSSSSSRTSSNTSITPTMSREQALAQIRERRGRARSLANGTTTPRKVTTSSYSQQAAESSSRRDISAPVSTGGGAAFRGGPVRGRSGVRS